MEKTRESLRKRTLHFGSRAVLWLTISHWAEQLLDGCATRDTTGLRYLDSIVDCNSNMFSQSECQNIYIFYSIHICKLLLLPPSLNIISQLNEKLDIYCGFYIFYDIHNLCGAQTCIPLLDNKDNRKQPHSQNSDLESIHCDSYYTYFICSYCLSYSLSLCSWICSGLWLFD